MAEAETLTITGDSVKTLEAMADHARIDCLAFTDQSLEVGLYLAEIILGDSGIGRGASVLFEEPDSTYIAYEIDFSSQEREKPATDAEAALATLEAEFQEEPLTLALDQGRLAEVTRVSELLGVSRPGFISSSLFFRWRWALTRGRGGDILVRSVTSGEDFLVEPGRFAWDTA